MTIKLSGLGGGGGVPGLAPDLTWPAGLDGRASNPYTSITSIDASSGLTTALSLTGKFAVSYISFDGVSNEDITIKLTVDGVIIWNATRTAAAGILNLIGDSGAFDTMGFSCQNSLLLEVQTAADTDISLYYMARPIL